MEQQNLQPTPASQWGGKIDVQGTALPLPSGNVALVRALSPQAFLSSGMIPDPLMAIVRKAIHTKKGLPPREVNKIADDPEMLSSTMRLFDEVLARQVAQPPIQMPPPCDVEVNGEPCGEYANEPVHRNPTESGHHAYREGAREEDVLYADQVLMEDKIYIFNWCLGGTKDLEKFREQQQGALGTVLDGEDVQVPAK